MICLYDTAYKRIGTLELSMENGVDGVQCYSCQMVGVNHLLTASDNLSVIWDLEKQVPAHTWKFDKIDSGHRIGGERNPDDIAYVFDSKAEPDQGCCCQDQSTARLLATALSDGTVRVVDMLSKGVVAILKGPERSHLTAVDWSAHRPILAVCSGDGSIGLWERRMWRNTKCIVVSAISSVNTVC